MHGGINVSLKNIAHTYTYGPGVPLFFGRKWRSCSYYIGYILTYYTYNNIKYYILYLCVCVFVRTDVHSKCAFDVYTE